MITCLSCGKPLAEAAGACEACGRLLAGMRQVALEPLQEEASVAYGLLQSAGLHPSLAYVEESGEPHPLDPEIEFGRSAGLMVPVTTPIGLFVPEAEAEESLRVLEDARRALDDAELPPAE
jgi:hypothetical protein